MTDERRKQLTRIYQDTCLVFRKGFMIDPHEDPDGFAAAMQIYEEHLEDVPTDMLYESYKAAVRAVDGGKREPFAPEIRAAYFNTVMSKPERKEELKAAEEELPPLTDAQRLESFKVLGQFYESGMACAIETIAESHGAKRTNEND
jgi:hypothetical protein